MNGKITDCKYREMFVLKNGYITSSVFCGYTSSKIAHCDLLIKLMECPKGYEENLIPFDVTQEKV